MSMENEKGQIPKSPNRRRFIKSLLGLGGVIEASAEAREPVKQDEKFFWADLKVGNIGFPTGLSVPSTRPGSIMKLITAASLIEEGIYNPNELIECTGFTQTKWSKYSCPKAHGKLTLEKAIGLSCNVYFAIVSKKLRSQTVLGYARQFGLDQPISGQQSGEFPTQVDENSTNYCLGLHKQLKPNALQLLRVAALIGANGEIPYLRSAEMADMKGEPFRIDLKEETLTRLKEGMRLAAQIGTAKNLDKEDKLKLAVKTGTVGHGNKFESWIIGYFPFDEPKHAFSLFAPVGTSHDSAVPLASKRLLSVDWP